MKLGNEVYRHKVIVADIVDDCILGLDFMKKHRCEIDVNQGVMKCGTEEVFMEGASSGKVYCLKKVILHPRSETIIPVSLPTNFGQENRCVIIEGLNNDASWKIARTLARGTNVCQ